MIIAYVSKVDKECYNELRGEFTDVKNFSSIEDFINFYAASKNRDVILLYRVESCLPKTEGYCENELEKPENREFPAEFTDIRFAQNNLVYSLGLQVQRPADESILSALYRL